MRSERLTIGTHPDADVQLIAEEGYDLPTWQAEIVFNETGSVNLRDYGSKYGTFVKRARLGDLAQTTRISATTSVEFNDHVSFGGSARIYLVHELWLLLHEKLNRNPMFPPLWADVPARSATPTDLPPWHGIE